MLSNTLRMTSSRSMMAFHRTFTSTCKPAERLRSILEEYRRQHYTRETPRQFQRDIFKCCSINAVSDDKNMIPVDTLNKILVNIGRSDQLLTEDEMQTLCREVGNGSSRSIPKSEILSLV